MPDTIRKTMKIKKELVDEILFLKKKFPEEIRSVNNFVERATAHSIREYFRKLDKIPPIEKPQQLALSMKYVNELYDKTEEFLDTLHQIRKKIKRDVRRLKEEGKEEFWKIMRGDARED